MDIFKIQLSFENFTFVFKIMKFHFFFFDTTIKSIITCSLLVLKTES